MQLILGGGGVFLNESQIKELALISWTIRKYTLKFINENRIEHKARPLQSTLSRLENFLLNCGVEIIDYEGAKFNDGMNVEIIDTIQIDTQESFVKESIEPSIICKGQMLHKARIIKAISKE